MKKKILALSTLSLLFFGACNADLSRQTDYNYDRSVVDKTPSGGGKVDYADNESGYIRHTGENINQTDLLNRGTNLDNRNVKAPAVNNPQRIPHVHP